MSELTIHCDVSNKKNDMISEKSQVSEKLVTPSMNGDGVISSDKTIEESVQDSLLGSGAQKRHASTIDDEIVPNKMARLENKDLCESNLNNKSKEQDLDIGLTTNSSNSSIRSSLLDHSEKSTQLTTQGLHTEDSGIANVKQSSDHSLDNGVDQNSKKHLTVNDQIKSDLEMDISSKTDSVKSDLLNSDCGGSLIHSDHNKHKCDLKNGETAVDEDKHCTDKEISTVENDFEASDLKINISHDNGGTLLKVDDSQYNESDLLGIDLNKTEESLLLETDKSKSKNDETSSGIGESAAQDVNKQNDSFDPVKEETLEVRQINGEIEEESQDLLKAEDSLEKRNCEINTDNISLDKGNFLTGGSKSDGDTNEGASLSNKTTNDVNTSSGNKLESLIGQLGSKLGVRVEELSVVDTDADVDDSSFEKMSSESTSDDDEQLSLSKQEITELLNEMFEASMDQRKKEKDSRERLEVAVTALQKMVTSLNIQLSKEKQNNIDLTKKFQWVLNQVKIKKQCAAVKRQQASNATQNNGKQNTQKQPKPLPLIKPKPDIRSDSGPSLSSLNSSGIKSSPIVPPPSVLSSANIHSINQVTTNQNVLQNQILQTTTTTPKQPIGPKFTKTNLPTVRHQLEAKKSGFIDLTDDDEGTISKENTTVPRPIRKTSFKHPAPLPEATVARHNVPRTAKLLPPKPGLKLSKLNSGIVLSWNMEVTDKYESIKTYQLFAYQETNAPPQPMLWKKVGDVQALPLPMACTLTQFNEGHRYHFAVRAVDTYGRLGKFSEPNSIQLTKKSN